MRSRIVELGELVIHNSTMARECLLNARIARDTRQKAGWLYLAATYRRTYVIDRNRLAHAIESFYEPDFTPELSTPPF